MTVITYVNFCRIAENVYVLFNRFVDAETGEVLNSEQAGRSQTIRTDGAERFLQVFLSWAESVAEAIYGATEVVFDVNRDLLR